MKNRYHVGVDNDSLQGHVDAYCTPEKLDNTKLDLYHTQENDSQAATVPECTENKPAVVEPNEDKNTGCDYHKDIFHVSEHGGIIDMTQTRFTS